MQREEAVAESTHPSSPSSDKSMQTLISELWDLIVRYAKQETLDPLKTLFRFVAWGLAGSACLALGTTLISIGILRLVQQELAPHLTGNWSWVPYLILVAFAGVVIGLLVRAIGGEKRRALRERIRLEQGGRG